MITFEELKKRYQAGRISIAMLQIYVRKGVITQEEYEEIISSND